jgi:recombinational DNA repair protein (RecF pathway)
LHTLQCLAAAGYEPELGSCVECRMPLVEGGWWSALRGGLLCEVCRDTQEGGGYKKIQKGTVRALSFGLTHSLNEINRLERSAPVLSEIEEVVETLLWAHAPVLPAVSLRQMVSC